MVLLAGLALALGVGLLTQGQAAAEGIRQGLSVCAGILIPALFPFMALSCFLVRSDATALLSLPLRPITTKVLRLPCELGAVVLLSLVSGYPVGAKMIASLLEQRRIDEATARRMLCFCFGPSPSFLISAVGAGMLMNERAGVVLYASQVAATLIVGGIVSLRTPLPAKDKASLSRRSKGVFVSAVTDASASMLGMCAFAVLFSGVLALLRQSGIMDALARGLSLRPELVNAATAGLLEVTGGCLASARLGGETAVVAVSLCCSWGGLSAIFQMISFFREKKPDFGLFFLSRLAHGCLAVGAALPLYRQFCAEVPAWGSALSPVVEVDGESLLACLCLLAMCSILVLHTENVEKSRSNDVGGH